jgi:4-hydroxyphenylpyruvate dioxygenase-like putative hemolysin
MNKLDSNIIVQIGIIVTDIEQKACNYAEIFGIPVPKIVTIADEPISNTQYRGKLSSATGKAAFFDLGAIQMELIEPVGAPSTWEEFLRTHGEGLHHIALRTENMAEAVQLLESKGLEAVQSGAWDGGQYTYVEGTKQLGTILELLHND